MVGGRRVSVKHRVAVAAWTGTVTRAVMLFPVTGSVVPSSESFVVPGTFSSFVPAGVTTATVAVVGGNGGAGGSLGSLVPNWGDGGAGGGGGQATATIPVEPCTALTVNVGGNGADSGSITPGPGDPFPGDGGSNGGGAGGRGGIYETTAVAASSVDVIASSGGGGAGQDAITTDGGAGGGGGGSRFVVAGATGATFGPSAAPGGSVSFGPVTVADDATWSTSVVVPAGTPPGSYAVSATCNFPGAGNAVAKSTSGSVAAQATGFVYETKNVIVALVVTPRFTG